MKEHIKNWMEELDNPFLSQKRAIEIRERLALVDVKDYYEVINRI